MMVEMWITSMKMVCVLVAMDRAGLIIEPRHTYKIARIFGYKPMPFTGIIGHREYPPRRRFFEKYDYGPHSGR